MGFRCNISFTNLQLSPRTAPLILGTTALPRATTRCKAQTTRTQSSNSELSLGVSRPGDRKSGELACPAGGGDTSHHHILLSGLSSGGWGCGAAAGPTGPTGARRLPRAGISSPPSPARIPKRGTQLALFHGQLEAGAAARGASESKAQPSAPLSLPTPACPAPAASASHPLPSCAPASFSQRAVPQSRHPFRSPSSQSPRKSDSHLPADSLRRRVFAGRARQGAGPRAEAGIHFPRETGFQRPEPGNRRSGLTRALRFTWHGRRLSEDVRSRLLQGGRPAHIAANPTERPVSCWVPLTPARGSAPALPSPHPPVPSVKSVTAFLPPDLLQSLRVVTRSWAAMPGALTPRMPCPCLPSAPCTGPRQGEDRLVVVTVP